MTDYIRRTDVLAILEKANDAFIRNGCVSEFITMAHLIKNVKQIPASDVRKNVRGEWGDVGCLENVACSVCGAWLDVLQGTAEMNFCPNCGAYMRKDD